MAITNDSRKISIKELSNILEVSYNTAKKDYYIFIDMLELKRKFLTIGDLKTLKLMN
jgi:DeoR/GlpR family transcriptional regulator of sugar metabolism